MSMTNSASGGAQQLIDAAHEAWPLFAAAGFGAFFFKASTLKNGFKQRTVLGTLANLTLQAIAQGILGGGAALIAPLFYEGISPAGQLGVGLLMGSFGVGFLWAFVRTKLGLTTADLMDANDIESVRDAMPQILRHQHIVQCPFHAHGDDCPESCPERDKCSNPKPVESVLDGCGDVSEARK